VVTSDDYDARQKFGKFAKSRDPWVLSVALLSEGVDLPRWRVLVMATTWADSRLYFDQIVGRIIRYRSERAGPQMAVAYLPDDPRYRSHAAKMTRDVQEYLKQRQVVEPPAERTEPRESLYAALGAVHSDGSVLSVGVGRQEARSAVATVADAPSSTDEYEQLVDLRKRVNRGVADVAARFKVAHRSIHVTLNERTGCALANADLRALEERLRVLDCWKSVGFYDGVR